MTEPSKVAPTPDAVPIRGPDGEVELYHARDVAQAIAAGGEVVSPEEHRQAELDRQYGGVGGSLAATGAGAARGLTVGLSDPLAIGSARALYGNDAAEKTRKTLAELQEAHPYLSTAGELAGAAAPLLASGGAAAAGEAGTLARIARTAGALPRAAAAGGRLAEQAASRALSFEATGLGARIVQKSVPAAIGAGAEGAAWGTGHEISDAALDDHELTAEKLWAGAGKGALLGSLTGGTLGAGGELASSAVRGISRSLAEHESVAAWLERKSGESVLRATGGGKKTIEAAHRAGFDHVVSVARDELPALVGKENFRELTPELIAEGAGRGIAVEGEKLGELLRQVDEAAARPLPAEPIEGLGGIAANENARAPLSWEREVTVPRTRAANDVGQDWEQVRVPGGPAVNDNVTGRARFRKGVSAWQQAEGASGLAANDNAAPFVSGIQEMEPLGQLAPANENANRFVTLPKRPLPRAADVVGDIESVASNLANHAGTESVQARLTALANSVKRVTGMVDETGELVAHAGDIGVTFTQLRNLRADVDNAWAGNGMNPELVGFKKEFYKVRDLLEKRLVDGADAVAKANGIEFRTAYTTSKQNYQAYKILAKAANSGASRVGANQVFGLGDKIVGGNLGIWGAHIGGALAGGPGAIIGGALGGLGGSLVNKAVREKGNFFAADILHKLGQLAAIERASAEVDRKIVQGVRSFLIPGESSQPTSSHRKSAKVDTIDVARGIVAARNPSLLQDRLERAVGSLGGAAPGITQHLGTKAATTVAFLSSKVPQERRNVATLTPQYEKPRTSDAEVKKFARYLEGATDPLSLLTDMKRGVLSREKVEAVKMTSPLIFAQIRDTVIDEAPRLKARLSYEKRLHLSILFDAPMDDTLMPQFLNAVQSTKGPPPPDKEGEGQKLGSKRPMKLDKKLFATPSEGLAA